MTLLLTLKHMCSTFHPPEQAFNSQIINMYDQNVLIKIIISWIHKHICEIKSHDYNQQLVSLFTNKNIIVNTKYVINYLIKNRFFKYTKITIEDLIYALILIDHLITAHSVQLSGSTAYYLLSISLIVSIKFNNDFYNSNHHYSKLTDINMNKINILELLIFRLLNGNLWIKSDELDHYCQYLGILVSSYKCNTSMIKPIEEKDREDRQDRQDREDREDKKDQEDEDC